MQGYHLRTSCFLVAVTIIVAVASFRVYSSFSARPKEEVRVQAEMLRAAQNASVPHYQNELQDIEADVIRGRAIEAARASLLSLDQRFRPTVQEAEAIATVFADFFLLNRTGVADDAIRRYSQRRMPLPRQLQNEDPEKRNISWAYSTAWARHRDIDWESVTTEAKYLRGNYVGQPYAGATTSSSRPLRVGGNIWDIPHAHTAYDITLRASAPNIDQSSVVDLYVHVTVVNDRPGGGWDVIQASYSNMPPGKVVLPPFP